MLTIPFLTDLDSRAAVKGTRDALGVQTIWTRFGRRVVGNLSTVSNSARDFAVTLLGYHFAEQLAEEQAGSDLATFLKWEQLAAYARAHVNRDFAFRGTERVRRRLSEGSKVTISDDGECQILGLQKIYGLWGLYTVPSRASGLLQGSPARLTPPAREAVDRLYLSRLSVAAGRGARKLCDVLRVPRKQLDLEGRDRSVIEAVGAVLARKLSPAEVDLYRQHLVLGGPSDSTGGLQPKLAQLLDESLDDPAFAWSPAIVGQLARRARRQGVSWHELGHRLERIRTVEQVLAPVALCFNWLLGLNDKGVSTIAARVREEWGASLRTVDASAFEELRDQIGEGDALGGERWVAIAHALQDGDYAQLISLLVQQNAEVMKDRGGSAWIEVENGRLSVRYRDEQGHLPTRAELPTLWRFPYFLSSLRSVSVACGGSGVQA
jgi:hypothetical protein